MYVKSRTYGFTTPLKRLSIVLVLALFSAGSFAAFEPLEPTSGQVKTAKDVVRSLEDRHYRDMRLDDQVSGRFLDNYLDMLDPAKTFFFQSDIDDFNKNRKRFDDALKSGNLELGFEIFNRYRSRMKVRLEAVLSQLKNEDAQFDFTKDEDLLVDTDDASYAPDQAEANTRWRKMTKSNLLNLMLADKSLEEAKETLIRRYTNQLKRLDQYTSTDAFETMMNALTTLYDPHTNYLSARTLENFNINMSLSLEGIGAVLKVEDEYTKVDRIVPAGPADKQGQLRPADRIVAVGQGDEGEMVDVIGWRLDEVVNLIRGPRNTVVRLEVLPPDNVPKTIRITRNTVKLEDQAAKKAVFELTDGESIYKVGVIDVPNFYQDFQAYRNGDPNYRSTTRDVRRLLDELEQDKVDGIILDLRDNGGGSLQEATMLTDLFLDPGPVVQIRQSDNRILRDRGSRSMAAFRKPMVVLVNRFSASASEIFAGAIQDYQRGLVVGNQSFGKGTVQSLVKVHEGELKITESKFYRVSGDSTQHRGVVPDVAFPDLIDLEMVGESSYDYALPWDQIHEAPHAKYYELEPMVPLLQSKHEERAANDPDFVYLVEQAEISKALNDRKMISLNLAERKAEEERLKKKAMSLENKRREAKGLTPYKDLETYLAAEGDEALDGEEEEPISDPGEISLEKDPVLNETGYVLVDYIKLQRSDRVQKVANF
ncbi:carboxy terminal-processing peptidase [Gilvimarinus sp. F26214L]|uniref:carboxy terminal-processing peptidase n=1 Tax=Gilvimarinus sp. DZF01 TaxID=3461371 RepID=UPI00404656F2